MPTILLLVIMGLITSITVAIMKAKQAKADKNPNNIESDQRAEETFAALCEADENIKVVCRGGYKGEYYAVTNKRLMINNKKGLVSIPLETIQKVRLQTLDGHKAKEPSDCYHIIINADKKYSFYRNSGKFDMLSSVFMYHLY